MNQIFCNEIFVVIKTLKFDTKMAAPYIFFY